ncbi:MAG: hypothetical protein R2865_14445 [Deinococcales bacterium]
MLDKLNAVQAHDLDIDVLVKQKGDTPQELIATQQKKEQLVLQLADLAQRYEALEQRINQNHLEMQSLEERRKAAAEAAFRSASGKEASQYQNQEIQFATRYQELAEDTDPLMASYEGLEQEINSLKSELDTLNPKLVNLLPKNS